MVTEVEGWKEGNRGRRSLTINNVEHYGYFVAVRWLASVIASVTFPH